MGKTTEDYGDPGDLMRVAILTDHHKEVGNPAQLQQLTEQLRLAAIDVLCCQGMERTFDGRRDPAREIAQSLRMAYSFSATDCRAGPSQSGLETILTGLWILAGAKTWMLNGGRFFLAGKGPCKNQVVQFAIIRKNCNSVLVLHTEFSPLPVVQRQQLQALFSHTLLRDHHDAVVLCGNRKMAVSKRDIQSATALSSYKLAHTPKKMSFEGDDEAVCGNPCVQSHSTDPGLDQTILTLMARNSVPSAVTIQGTPTVFRLESVLISEFAFKPVAVEEPHKFFRRCFPWDKVPKSKNLETGRRI